MHRMQQALHPRRQQATVALMRMRTETKSRAVQEMDKPGLLVLVELGCLGPVSACDSRRNARLSVIAIYPEIIPYLHIHIYYLFLVNCCGFGCCLGTLQRGF